MKSLHPFIQAALMMHAASLMGCVAATDEDLAQDTAEAEGALTGDEVLDQQQASFNGGGLPIGNASPVAQIFTPNHTGYLTKFAYAGAPCYDAWGQSCWYTLELRAVDESGNPGQVLWEGRAREPAAPDPGWAFAWATTGLSAPPFVHAGTPYALVLRPDWWMQVLLGNDNPGYAPAWQNGYNYWAHIGNGDDLMFKAWITPLIAPSTCAEVRAMNPSAGDGEYMLSIGGKYVRVYCADMAGTPSEYLTVRTGGGANLSYYGAGQNSVGLTTAYTKVRFHPDTLAISWNDTSFSSSQGWKRFGSTYYYTNGYAEAADCVGDNSKSGTANVDLRGTPFSVAPNQFVVAGWNPAGTMQYSTFGQVVNLTGGGYCGSNTPATDALQLTWLNDGDIPASCAGVRTQDPSAGDGEYTLALSGGPASIYCHDMAGTPKEYLTLPSAGPSTNYSQYTAGGYVSGTNVRTNYTKVRLDPATLLVDISDQTFATSTGQLVHGSATVTSMPFAVAMSCSGWANGEGNIDLTGTPFAVAPNEFVHNGWAHSGSWTLLRLILIEESQPVIDPPW